jgi:hypothetical protein
MSDDPNREQEELEEQDGELLTDRELMSTLRFEPEPPVLEPDPKTLNEEWSPEDPPPGT